MKKLIKNLGLLTIFIILCAITARILTGAETLADYAEKNPETAYATPSKTPKPAAPSALPETTPTPTHTLAPVPTPEPDPIPENREVYQPGFYKEPLSDELIAYISGVSFPEAALETLSYEDLRHLEVLHYDFNGEVQTGELICNQAIADDLLEIFYELYQNKYQIEKIRLIEEYDGDDTLSMEDNNTSCFNYRIVEVSGNLSKHALGMAIDINPLYNPYVVFRKDGNTYVSPAGSEIYTDRSKEFPYKIDENDLCYELFKKHGFTWGGKWNSMKDYQHFHKALK